MAKNLRKLTGGVFGAAEGSFCNLRSLRISVLFPVCAERRNNMQNSIRNRFEIRQLWNRAVSACAHWTFRGRKVVLLTRPEIV